MRRRRRAKAHKFHHVDLTQSMLDERAAQLEARGFAVSKWIRFCSALLSDGYGVRIDEAYSTHSKYLWITRPGIDRGPYKVRFSNHPAGATREANGDCDFFVGKRSDGTYPTTDDAMRAVTEFFS